MQVEAKRHQSEWKSRYWTAQEHERFLEVFLKKRKWRKKTKRKQKKDKVRQQKTKGFAKYASVSLNTNKSPSSSSSSSRQSVVKLFFFSPPPLFKK
jgi:hypothetical protein